MPLPLESLAVSCVLFAASAHAASVPLSQLDDARAAAGSSFRAAARRLADAKDATRKAGAALKGCKSGKLQLEFTATLSRLETARKALELGRRRTQALRRGLERARERLEAERRSALSRRGKSATGVAAAEQAWSEEMVTGYVKPLQEEVVPLLDAYTAGITGYAATLERYGQFCAQGSITGKEARDFVAEVAPGVEQLSASAERFAERAGKR